MNVSDSYESLSNRHSLELQVVESLSELCKSSSKSILSLSALNLILLNHNQASYLLELFTVSSLDSLIYRQVEITLIA